ncbi:hypothetical protein [Ensifer soli]|uniref:hypothetical protein n=1 Tax=Ciceribacter sp. sgz301302 TaxID=3342379 RepID=UPI0035B97A72
MIKPCLHRAVLILSLCSITYGGHAADGNTDRSVLNPLARIELQSLMGFRDRPLFSPSRARSPEPLPLELQEPAPEETAELNILLLGIVASPEGAVAHILDLSDDSRTILRRGDTFQGWHIVSVDTAGVTMRRDENLKYLSVFANLNE